MLAAQFIAGDVRTGFAAQAELRRLEGTCALGMRGGDALVYLVFSAHTAGGRLSEPVALLGRHGRPKSPPFPTP